MRRKSEKQIHTGRRTGLKQRPRGKTATAAAVAHRQSESKKSLDGRRRSREQKENEIYIYRRRNFPQRCINKVYIEEGSGAKR